MKKLLFLLLLLPCFCMGQKKIKNPVDKNNILISGDHLLKGNLGIPAYFRIDSNGILIPYNNIAIGGTVLPEQSSIRNIPIGKSSELGGGSMDTALYYYDTLITTEKRCYAPFDSGMVVSVDMPIIRTIYTDSTEGWNSIGGDFSVSSSGGQPFHYIQSALTIDTIKVKALITTDKIKAPFEVELLWVSERGGFSMSAIYPPPVRLNKYLSLDKKELPKTTTVWISNPIN